MEGVVCSVVGSHREPMIGFIKNLDVDRAWSGAVSGKTPSCDISCAVSKLGKVLHLLLAAQSVRRKAEKAKEIKGHKTFGEFHFWSPRALIS
jgi:hypothetical protein